MHSDPDILSGAPVFTGTRLPIELVLAPLEVGESANELKMRYPYLTDAHIEAARAYNQTHPRRGRSPRLNILHPDLTELRRKTLRPVKR